MNSTELSNSADRLPLLNLSEPVSLLLKQTNKENSYDVCSRDG